MCCLYIELFTCPAKLLVPSLSTRDHWSFQGLRWVRSEHAVMVGFEHVPLGVLVPARVNSCFMDLRREEGGNSVALQRATTPNPH